MKRGLYQAVVHGIVGTATVLLGAGGGYLLGLVAAFHETGESLRAYASARAAATDNVPIEALDVLAQMNTSRYPQCSEAELDSFRRLILKSHFVKDAGRMRGQQLACSAIIPAADLPDTKYTPAFVGVFNDLLYNSIDSLRIGSLIPIVMRKGDFYVALDPYQRDDIPGTIQFSLAMKNIPPGRSNYLGGNPMPASREVLTTDGYGRAGSNLYATKCSRIGPVCITAYISIRGALAGQQQLLWTWLLGGALLGVCVAGVLAFLRKRTQGIEQQLRRAIRQDKLHVVYQPLVDLTTREVVGAEALVRWSDEDGLAISPEVFVKIAEQRGFVNQVTELVVRHVLLGFAVYLSEHPEFRVNVNVSALDLADPSLLSMLEHALRRASVSPRSVGIELTESATARRQIAIDSISQLRQRGHQVFIDDFGTGYSSLAYLRDLSVDGIKIDKSFTQTVGTNSVTEGIVPQILAMATALNLSVVAEGIETETQYGYYLGTAMHLTAQGWLFGHPLPLGEFQEKWLMSEPAFAGAHR